MSLLNILLKSRSQKTITVHGKSGDYQKKVWVGSDEKPAPGKDKKMVMGAMKENPNHSHYEGVNSSDETTKNNQHDIHAKKLIGRTPYMDSKDHKEMAEHHLQMGRDIGSKSGGDWKARAELSMQHYHAGMAHAVASGIKKSQEISKQVDDKRKSEKETEKSNLSSDPNHPSYHDIGHGNPAGKQRGSLDDEARKIISRHPNMTSEDHNNKADQHEKKSEKLYSKTSQPPFENTKGLHIRHSSLGEIHRKASDIVEKEGVKGEQAPAKDDGKGNSKEKVAAYKKGVKKFQSELGEKEKQVKSDYPHWNGKEHADERAKHLSAGKNALNNGHEKEAIYHLQMAHAHQIVGGEKDSRGYAGSVYNKKFHPKAKEHGYFHETMKKSEPHPVNGKVDIAPTVKPATAPLRPMAAPSREPVDIDCYTQVMGEFSRGTLVGRDGNIVKDMGTAMRIASLKRVAHASSSVSKLRHNFEEN